MRQLRRHLFTPPAAALSALVALLAAAPLRAFAASTPPVFTGALDRREVALGDRVVATYSAELPEGASVLLESLVTPAPAPGSPDGEGSVLEYENPPAPVVEKGRPGFVVWHRQVAFTPFASGPVLVPGPHLVYVAPDGVHTPVRPLALELTVRSRLPKEEKPEKIAPKADRPARIPSVSPWMWALLAGGVALVALLVAWLFTRKKAAAAGAPDAPSIPPGAEFLAALARLSEAARSLGEDARSFYSELTHITKRYLERRLGEPVLEWTTFETLRRLRDKGLELPREIAFADLLSSADRVKFGKGQATRDEAGRHIQSARAVHSHLEALLAAREAAEARARAEAQGKANAHVGSDATSEAGGPPADVARQKARGVAS